MRPSFQESKSALRADFDAIRISLASPEKILSWSYGEVTKPERALAFLETWSHESFRS